MRRCIRGRINTSNAAYASLYCSGAPPTASRLSFDSSILKSLKNPLSVSPLLLLGSGLFDRNSAYYVLALVQGAYLNSLVLLLPKVEAFRRQYCILGRSGNIPLSYFVYCSPTPPSTYRLPIWFWDLETHRQSRSDPRTRAGGHRTSTDLSGTRY